MKTLPGIICLFAAAVLSAVAQPRLFLAGGTLRDEIGNPLPDNSVAALVVSTQDNELAPFSADTFLKEGNHISADDVVLKLLEVDSTISGVAGGFVGSLVIDYEALAIPHLDAGDQLWLVWLPATTASEAVAAAGASYGLYRADAPGIYSDLAWRTAPDTATRGAKLLRMLTADLLGDVEDSAALASLHVTDSPSSPAFAVQPNDQSAELGDSLVLSASAYGSGPLTYQWSFNDVPLPGATGKTLQLSDVQGANSGSYTVTVSNLDTQVTSLPSVVSVRVPEPPVITENPEARSVKLGRTTSFSVVTTSTLPLSYQWSHDGVPLDGANTDVLTLNNVQPVDAGSYTVTVSNVDGEATSIAALLTVLALEPPTIVVHPVDQSVKIGRTATFSVTVTSTLPLSYQWMREEDPIENATSDTLTLDNVGSEDAVFYSVIVGNEDGHVVSDAAALTILPLESPEIVTDPTDQSAKIGRSVSFSVEATSPLEPVAYQWHYNYEPIDGATADTLTFAKLRSEDAGGYFVTVSNADGQAVSDTASLTILPLEPPKIVTSPIDQSVKIGRSVSFTVEATSPLDPVAYQWHYNDEPIDGATTDTLALSALQPEDAGAYYVVVSNADGQVRTDSVTLSVLPLELPLITDEPLDLSAKLGRSAIFEVVVTSRLPVAYVWYRDDVPIEGFAGTTLELTEIGVADAGSYYVIASNEDGAATSRSATLTVLPLDLPQIVSQPLNQTVRHGDSVTMMVTAQSELPLTYQWKFGESAIQGATATSFELRYAIPYNQGNYSVTVSNADGAVTSDTVTLTVLPQLESPVISQQPESQTVRVGSNANLSVAASGNEPLAYQWYKNTIPIAGATGDLFSLINVQATDVANYHAVVTSGEGATSTSLFATLNITFEDPSGSGGAPAFLKDLHGWLMSEGGVGHIWSYPRRGPDDTYHWLFNGNLIEGANHTILTVKDVSLADEGSYAIVVSNHAGVTISEPIEIGVLPPSWPRITTGNVLAYEGDAVLLESAISSGTDWAYRWATEGKRISGETMDHLQLGSVAPSDEGFYTVSVFAIDPEYGEVYGLWSPRIYLTVIPSSVKAIQEISAPGYVPGGLVAIKNSLPDLHDALSVKWETALPEGWEFVSSDSSGAETSPKVGDVVLEWNWSSSSIVPEDFTYFVKVPDSQVGDVVIQSPVDFTFEAGVLELNATADPLVILQSPHEPHSADTNKDYRISLGELLRVIELYNTRHGTVRTGGYAVDNDTEDGFTPDPNIASSADLPLSRYHSADTSGEGMIDLSELLRVIELYNTRSGTVRTGNYRYDAESDDGFAPNPGPF